VRAALFLPDGSGTMSYGNESSLRLWDTSTGKELRKFALKRRQQVVNMGLSAALGPGAGRCTVVP